MAIDVGSLLGSATTWTNTWTCTSENGYKHLLV